MDIGRAGQWIRPVSQVGTALAHREQDRERRMSAIAFLQIAASILAGRRIQLGNTDQKTEKPTHEKQ